MDQEWRSKVLCIGGVLDGKEIIAGAPRRTAVRRQPMTLPSDASEFLDTVVTIERDEYYLEKLAYSKNGKTEYFTFYLVAGIKASDIIPRLIAGYRKL